MNNELKQRWERIRLLAMDVDGVLTNGGIFYGDDNREMRCFNAKDGLGLKLIMEAGIEAAVISLAGSEGIRFRGQQLGIHEIHLGVPDKVEALNRVRQSLGLDWSEIAYIGDDLPDLPVLRIVGLPCAPADATAAVLEAAAYITKNCGGRGAVRELCDLLLRMKTGSSAVD